MSFLTQLLLHPADWYRAHQLLVGQIGVNGLLAVSIWLTLYSGQLTLANVGFMAIGGYTSVILVIHLHLPLALTIVAGAGLAAVAGLVIGLPVLRLRGVYLAIATLGFGEALRFGILLNLGITGKGQGLTNPAASLGGGIAPIWLSLLAAMWVGWRLTRTRLGSAWAAVREDEVAAASGGVAVSSVKLVAFVAGAALAGWAGALDAHLNFFIDPSEYGVNRAIAVLVFAVVGGAATVVGPVVGAGLLSLLPEVLRFARDYRDAVNGAVLIAVMIFRPAGLVPGRGTSGAGRRGRSGLGRLGSVRRRRRAAAEADAGGLPAGEAQAGGLPAGEAQAGGLPAGGAQAGGLPAGEAQPGGPGAGPP